MAVAQKSGGAHMSGRAHIKGFSPKRQARPGFRLDGRAVWFAAALLVFSLSTFFAFTQKPRRNAYATVTTFTLDWWQNPIEGKAMLRLPVVTGTLRSVFARSGTDKVWAVGNGGLILHSEDGGRTWEQQTVQPRSPQQQEDPQQTRPQTTQESAFHNLLSPSTALAGEEEKNTPPEVGRTIGAQSLTISGGPFILDLNAPPAVFTDADKDTLSYGATSNYPKIANVVINGSVLRVAAVTAGDAIVTVSASDGKSRPINIRFAVTISDSPAPAQVVEVPADTAGTFTADLQAIYFVNSNNGWAVGAGGTILNTSNGGNSWQKQTSGTSNDLISINFTDPDNGWAVGDNGTILNTTNGGKNWQNQFRGTSNYLWSITFTDPDNGWAAGEGGTILNTTDGGKNWQKQTSGIFNWLSSVTFTDPNNGWAVGEMGTILNTTDSGKNWQKQTSGISNWLYSITFINTNNGWAVGEGGTILNSTDGGNNWQNQASGTSNFLYSLIFTDTNNGWAVGAGGTVLGTTDTGKKWFSQTQPDTLQLISTEGYRKYPAPWYYISLILIGFLFIPVFKKPLPTEETEIDESIADMLISDRPLEINDPDPLGFKPIALGLSRFIRNENTQPPLTVAISGQWGSGKSSLMNMLKADLRQNKFQSIWFNAWHHQKEEHLLAALLENIKNQAVPPLLAFKNIAFRYRLLKIRLKRNWRLVFILTLIYSAIVGALLAQAAAAQNPLGDLKGFNISKISDFFVSQNGIWSLIWLSAVLPLGAIGRAMRAFGVKPARLMASMSGRFRVRDFTAQAGFRYRFEREFKDVTRALSPHGLVILIDDLDRCKPENVLEVLEAVNFLVSAGGCFIVLGLDLDRVERCVGLGFKDVAEELLDDTMVPELQNNNDKNAISEAGKRRRAQFARQYLEKLINIEVPVPEPSEAQARNLLVPSTNGVIPARSIWQSAATELAQRTRALLPAIILAATITFGFWGGRTLMFEPIQEEPSGPLDREQSPDETKTSKPDISSKTQPEPERGTETSKFESGKTARFPKTIFAAPLLLLLGLGIWRLSIQPESIVRDSPEFRQALGVWSPMVYAKQPTPRSVKRFMNRLRYFAMRLPEEESRKSIWMRLKAFWERIRGKEVQETVAAKKDLTEATLVALSAMYHFNHEWLEDKQNWSKIKKGEVVMLSDGSPEDIGQMQLLQIRLQDAIKGHKAKFGQWPPTEKDIKKLLNLSKGIRVS